MLLLQKEKRGFLGVVFAKTTILLFIIILQITAFTLFLIYLRNYVSVLTIAVALFTLAMILYLVSASTSSEAKLSWIAIVIILPIIGAVIYIWAHTDPGCRIEKNRAKTVDQNTEKFRKNDVAEAERIESPENGYGGTISDLRQMAGYSAYENTKLEYCPSGESFFESLIEELEKAEKFIFMEFFIIQEGYMWGRVLDVLARKAAQGVEVRVMYDGSCIIFRLPYEYPKEVEKLGIKCKMFSRLRPFLSTSYNNRDHRKIVVIDGNVAFTGGSNLADEYINLKHPFGKWKDASIKLRGEAVNALTLMFLKMWDLEEKGNDFDYDKYLCAEKIDGVKGCVVPYGDVPVYSERIGEYVYIDIINRAKKYVYIMSPYLILDSKMAAALTLAAKKGTDVRIIIPHIPDKKYAFVLAKSHYAQLTAVGVKIYEYTPGFIHSKVFLSDDEVGVVGTINLDYRSLYLHYECAVYMRQTPILSDIEKDFEETLKESMLVTEETIKNEKFGTRIAGKLLKIIAPLM